MGIFTGNIRVTQFPGNRQYFSQEVEEDEGKKQKDKHLTRGSRS